MVGRPPRHDYALQTFDASSSLPNNAVALDALNGYAQRGANSSNGQQEPGLPERWFTVQRVHAMRCSGTDGDSANTGNAFHQHTLEESDSIMKNTVQRQLLAPRSMCRL